MYYSTNSETTRKRDAALTATPDRSAKATLIDLDHSYSWMSHHRGALGADRPRPLPPHKTPPPSIGTKKMSGPTKHIWNQEAHDGPPRQAHLGRPSERRSKWTVAGGWRAGG